MIDWLSFVIPCAHSKAINGGAVVSVDASGVVQWHSAKWKPVAGSYESAIQVRTARHAPGELTYLEVSGNPVKWFQGHNLWGTDDLVPLIVETMHALANIAELGLTPTDSDRLLWSHGSAHLTRVDVTQSFHLDNRPQVLSWLRAAEATAHLSHRGRGQLVKGGTLYFGKHSRRWSLKLYSKGQEIEAPGHGQSAILSLPHARAWADRTLRAELTLRGMELRRLGLGQAGAWRTVDGVPLDTAQLLHERLGGMTMTTTDALSTEVMQTLRPALRTAVIAWQAGADLRATLSLRTFYRYRAELLPHGIDIATLIPKQGENVVSLRRVLEARPVGVPEWAQGTPLYFEPRRRIA